MIKKLYVSVFTLSVVYFFCCISTAKTETSHRTIPEPVFLKGPYLQSASARGIVIRWRTDIEVNSVVKYGDKIQKLDNVVRVQQKTKEHIVEISGLKPSTKYYYSIGDHIIADHGNTDYYFVTLPEPGTEGFYRIAAFGDCGNNSDNQKNVRDQIVKYLGNNNLTAWLLLGDNAYEYGTDAEYEANFFGVFKNDLLKKYPLFPTPGNHEYRTLGSNWEGDKTHSIAYYQNFSVPINGESGGVPSHNPSYYSFDVGNIHFLSLDSYGREEKISRLYDTLSPQVQWVKKDLETNRNKGWIVAYWHHPPYTMGSHNSDKETELAKIRENFIKILERYGVDLVLCGHSHGYERSKLMFGHYGKETSFNASVNNVSQSSGLYNGTALSCPYIKDLVNNKGIVYVVAGSAGKIDSNTQPSFPHDAMFYSNAKNGGAMMMEVQGNRFDVKWICADGVIRDQFTMMKNVNKKTNLKMKRGQTISLTASFIGEYNWSNTTENSKTIKVSPPPGKTTYTVADKFNCISDVFEIDVVK